MNGQIQYGSARPLTAEPTAAFAVRDPGRFATRTSRRRIVLAATGGLLLIVVVLAAARLPAVAALVALGSAWVSLVLAMTLPSRSELARRELAHRLAEFRHELNAVGDAPAQQTLERLIARASELGLREDEIGDELTELRASMAALELRGSLSRGELPLAETPDAIAGEPCHFVCPVRLGRRRADQFGHLLMSTVALRYRGSNDLTVGWSKVAGVQRHGRDIVVVVRDQSKPLRFRCQSEIEAARGGAIAEHLACSARAGASVGAPGCHVSA